MANIVLPFLNSVHSHFNLGSQPARQGSGIGGIALPIIQPVLVGGGGGGNVLMNVHGNLGDVRDYQNEERNDARASTAAVVGAIGTVVMAGVSAFALRSYCNDREELKLANEFKEQLNTNPALRNMNAQNKFDLKHVTDKVIDLLEAKCARSRNIVILTAAALATAIAGFVAGMLSVQWLITASIITGVALAAVTVFMIVWNCTARSELTSDIVQKVEQLRQNFAN